MQLIVTYILVISLIKLKKLFTTSFGFDFNVQWQSAFSAIKCRNERGERIHRNDDNLIIEPELTFHGSFSGVLFKYLYLNRI